MEIGKVLILKAETDNFLVIGFKNYADFLKISLTTADPDFFISGIQNGGGCSNSATYLNVLNNVHQSNQPLGSL